MKRLIKAVAPQWRRVVLAGVFSAVISSLNGSIAWLVKPVVDTLLVAGNRAYLLLIAGVLLCVFLFRGVFTFAQNYLMRSAGTKIARDLRDDIYSLLLHLPMGRYAGDSTGGMMSIAINDTGLVQEVLAFRVRDLFLQGGTVLALTGVAFWMRWDLALVALVVLPLAFYVAGRLGKRLREVAMRAQEKISEITESYSEGMHGIKVIKSFTMESLEAARFKEINQGYYREIMKSTRILEGIALVMEISAGIGIAFLVWYGSSLVIEQAMTPGEFFSFLTAVLMIYTPAKRVSRVYGSLEQAGASLHRIDQLLESGREQEGTQVLGDIKHGIVFKNVSFCYETKQEDALTDISLDVMVGEVIAIVGRSGSGKTTFADLMAAFYRPTSGQILFDGVDINNVTKHSLRSKIGIVSQDVVLFDDTVRANIGYGRPDAKDDEITAAARAAYAHEFIMQLPQGYDTDIGQGGIRLSGGQRQRIAIARAVLKNPPILILDEATSALDTQSEKVVQEALDDLLKTTGARTTFVIAHRLSTVSNADRIIVLDKGRLVEEGPHKELMEKDGLYKKLYELQLGGGQ